MTHEPVNEEYVAMFPPFDHSFSRELEKRIANGEFNSVEEVIAVVRHIMVWINCFNEYLCRYCKVLSIKIRISTKISSSF